MSRRDDQTVTRVMSLRRNYSMFQASQVALEVKSPPANAGRFKRCGFNPWVGKIPSRRAWKPTLVFMPAESHGQRTLMGYNPSGSQSQTQVKQLSTNNPHSNAGLTSGGGTNLQGSREGEKSHLSLVEVS